MSSPRCNIVGFDVNVVSACESFDGADAGGGRPESCGVGVAADILGMW